MRSIHRDSAGSPRCGCAWCTSRLARHTRGVGLQEGRPRAIPLDRIATPSRPGPLPVDSGEAPRASRPGHSGPAGCGALHGAHRGAACGIAASLAPQAATVRARTASGSTRRRRPASSRGTRRSTAWPGCTDPGGPPARPDRRSESLVPVAKGDRGIGRRPAVARSGISTTGRPRMDGGLPGCKTFGPEVIAGAGRLQLADIAHRLAPVHQPGAIGRVDDGTLRGTGR